MKSISNSSLPTFLVETREEAERVVADEIASLVRAKPEAVLGLATGNTPIGVYRELIQKCATRETSFARATTFNLDEYLDLPPGHAGSFRVWMQRTLFAHLDLAPERTNLPELDGAVSGNAIDAHAVAAHYESSIRAAGGLDLQILGIGRNGHIGFNEPGSSRDSRTRVVQLHATTREDAARSFGGIEAVPVRALTMGVATILDARRIRVLAFGAHKSAIVRRTLFDDVSSECPSTFLRGHADVALYVDREAASELDVVRRSRV